MAVQKDVADRWEEVTGAPLIEAYGLTEASPAVCVNPMNLKEYNGAIGVPLPSTEVKLIDENEVLRVKGFLNVKGKPLRLLVQAVGTRLSVSFTNTDPGITSVGNLVVIAEKSKVNINGFTQKLKSD